MSAAGLAPQLTFMKIIPVKSEQIPDFGIMIGQMISNINDNDMSIAVTSGTVANLVGHIPDPMWDYMMKHCGDPCDTPGCNCHVEQQKLFDGLHIIRNKWKELTGHEKEGGEDEKGFSA